MGVYLGIILEILVATLLVATIAYCMIVNRKLAKLRADQENLKSVIRDLNQSTLHAEAAAGELRKTVNKAGKELAIQINRAEVSNLSLRKQNDNADGLLDKLFIVTKIARDKLETQKSETFTPRSGFPLEGLVEQESYPEVQPELPNTELWPQLKLSNLSSNGMPGTEQKAPGQPQDNPTGRRRFQWES